MNTTKDNQEIQQTTLARIASAGLLALALWGCASDSTTAPTTTPSSKTASSALQASSIAPTSSAGTSSSVALASSSTLASSSSQAVAQSSMSGFLTDVIWTPTVHGTLGSGQILDAQSADGGWWYSYTDATNDGGSGTVSWANDVGLWSQKIDSLGYIAVTMSNGTGAAYPYTGIGFNWISDANGGEGPYSIAAKTGLCVRYKSDKPITMELKWSGATYGYANFAVTLAAATVATTRSALFASFKQGYADALHPGLSIDTALAQTSGVQFKFAGNAGTAAHFELYGLGFNGACTN